jgi:hypothetical protein
VRLGPKPIACDVGEVRRLRATGLSIRKIAVQMGFGTLTFIGCAGMYRRLPSPLADPHSLSSGGRDHSNVNDAFKVL